MIQSPGAAVPLPTPRRCAIAALGAVLLVSMALRPASAATPSERSAGAVAVDQPIAQLIKAIEDPAMRARLIAALRAAEAAPAGATHPAAPTAAPETVLPRLTHRLGAHLLDTLSSGIAWFGGALHLAGRAMRDPTALFAAIESRLADAQLREFVVGLVLAIGLAMAAGLAADFAVGRFLAGAGRRVGGKPPKRLWQRAAGSLALFAIDLLRLAALAAAALAALAVVQPAPVERLCALVVVDAVILDRAIRSAGRLLLRPTAPAFRLFRLGDETAAYLYIWLRRLTIVAVYGYGTVQEARLFGLETTAYALATKALGLVVTVMLAVFAVQNRRAVALYLAPRSAVESVGAWPVLRRRLAETWHLFAVAYLVAAYVVWASEAAGGFAYLARGVMLTALILAVAGGVAALARRGLRRLLQVNRELLARNPLVEARANRYLPALRRTVGGVVWFAAGLAVLAAWQVDVAEVLANPLVSRGIAHLAAAAVVIVVALAFWEATDLAITMYLERKDAGGTAVIRSARIRTLLPLLRNAALILILLLALLTALAQLGVNTAPLLAGAGVVGLAIGFGSQTLVKDVITGAFILFEDTVNVGDVASINGTSGVVEAITIRTVRLRAVEGTVHTIPFGSVATISNMTKDYSMYLLDIGVAYKENTDRVVAAMREVFADLAADATYANDIIGELEVLGLDRFADSAVYVRARIKTLPTRQWRVGREYNRRMKIKFDELGIEMPFPHRTIYFGEPTAKEATESLAESRRVLAVPGS